MPTPTQVFHFLTHPRQLAMTPEDQAALADAERLDVEHRGIGLAVWAWGQGRPVLLLHGWEGQAGHMSAFVQPLMQAGFRVLAMDAPGHGHSARTATDAVDYGRAVVSVVDALGMPIATIGHSVGSAAALFAFGRGVAPQLSVHLAGPSSMVRVLRQGATAAGLDEVETQEVLERMAAQIGEPLEVMDLEHLLAGCRHRSLILHDPEDREMPYAESVALAAAWPGSTLQPLAAVGHRRLLRHPAVVSAVTRFVLGAGTGN